MSAALRSRTSTFLGRNLPPAPNTWKSDRTRSGGLPSKAAPNRMPNLKHFWPAWRSWAATTCLCAAVIGIATASCPAAPAARFDGQFFSGAGDAEYLRLLDTARRMFAPDPEYQNLAMLYMPAWNGLVEG